MPEKITINKRAVGTGEPVFVIAEAGVNHNGQLELAMQLVETAKSAGADAVKFQTFNAENLIAPGTVKAEYQKRTTGSEESQLEMISRLQLSYEDFRKLKLYSDELGIIFLSTPFDFQSVDFLHELNVPAFKISSGDLTNHPLLKYVAGKNRPVILSTGMSSLDEVREAVHSVRNTSDCDLAVLHCVTSYPADPSEVNLLAMQTMRTTLELPVGYSDHTLGIEVPIAAVALGASIVEKHFTMDKTSPGPDHQASLEPDDLRAMITAIRRVELALGDGKKTIAASEKANAAIARRSLVAAQDIPAGAVMTDKLIAIKRPGTGLPPKMLSQILGLTTRVHVPAGTLLDPEMFE
jgi:N-acetylneuraminate synthase/N,N'-diacetyllegionaminate synthase